MIVTDKIAELEKRIEALEQKGQHPIYGNLLEIVNRFEALEKKIEMYLVNSVGVEEPEKPKEEVKESEYERILNNLFVPLHRDYDWDKNFTKNLSDHFKLIAIEKVKEVCKKHGAPNTLFKSLSSMEEHIIKALENL